MPRLWRLIDRRSLMAQTSPTNSGAEYVSALYQDRVHWYQDVLTRAQILLGIEGVFAGFLAASLFGKAGDVHNTVSHFWWDTWAFLIAMGGSLAASLWFSVLVLIPKIDRHEIDCAIDNANKAKQAGKPYPPNVMWWFRYIERLDGPEFVKEAVAPPPRLLTSTLADNVYSLSKHLDRKYKRLSWAVRFISGAIIAFLATGASYLWHIAH